MARAMRMAEAAAGSNPCGAGPDHDGKEAAGTPSCPALDLPWTLPWEDAGGRPQAEGAGSFAAESGKWRDLVRALNIRVP
ncbi:hypothetical protein ACFQU2_10600 [Siccirubricoccus deserti]